MNADYVNEVKTILKLHIPLFIVISVVYRNLIDEMKAPILYIFKCSNVSLMI